MNPRWSRRISWTALALAAATAAGLIFLVATTVLDKSSGSWAKAFLFLLGVAATLAAVVATDDTPLGSRRRRSWLKPRPVAAVFLAIFLALGVATDALSLLQPKPAVESVPGALESAVAEISRNTAPRAVSSTRIRSRIGGLWGEPGCAIAYRFAVKGDALVVDAERWPRDGTPFQLVATITSVRDDMMTVSGEEPQAARGRSAVFTYFTNGVVERLRWDDRSRPVPLDLDRCG